MMYLTLWSGRPLRWTFDDTLQIPMNNGNFFTQKLAEKSDLDILSDKRYFSCYHALIFYQKNLKALCKIIFN